MKKRILVFLMICGMLSFAGCGKKDAPKEAVSEAASKEEAVSAENKEADAEKTEEEAPEEEAPEITAEEALASKEEEEPATGERRRIAVYVEGYNEEDGSIFVDEVEWLTAEDSERLAELGMAPEDLSDGYYINNPYDRLDAYDLTENTKFYVIDYETGESADVSREEWYEKVVIGSLNWLRLNGTEVESVEEQYLP